LSDGVGDVVKFQVEEDAHALVGEATNERGSFEREETAADLDAVYEAMKCRCEFERAGARLDVECD